MLTYYHAVREAATRIAAATDRSVHAFTEGRVEQEPAMTDRMLGAIEESLDGAEIRGIRWTAKTLTDRGPGAQESLYGADFLGVLTIGLPDFSVSKGFLAQAKIARSFSERDTEILRGQCRKMLRLSPASFVFLYSKDGIHVIPAIAVVGCRKGLDQLYQRSVQRFFEEHLECFIGDRSISSPTPSTLTALRDEFNSRSALLITAKEG